MKVVIAGGGTGGHLLPALALAEEFRDRDPNGRVVLVAADRPLDRQMIESTSFEHVFLPAFPVSGLPPLTRAKNFLRVGGAIIKAVKTLRSLPGFHIIGVGGYASFSITAAGAMLRRVIYLQEQNSVPGLANKWASRWARAVFLGFPEAADEFGRDQVVVTGNPIRKTIEQGVFPYTPPNSKSSSILVLGGSQGARSLDEAMIRLVQNQPNLLKGWKIRHQTNPISQEKVEEAYRQAGLDFEIRPFFQNIETVYSKSHLVIARAGALTVSELALTGRPAILIPLPHAAGNHQTKNAQHVADRGGAVLLPEERAVRGQLTTVLSELLNRPDRLVSMSRAISTSLPTGGREKIVETVLAGEGNL